jgi:hypothetical protein
MENTVYLIDGREVDFITNFRRVGPNQLNLALNAVGVSTMLIWSQQNTKLTIQIGVGLNCLLGEFQVMSVESMNLGPGHAVLMGNFVDPSSV